MSRILTLISQWSIPVLLIIILGVGLKKKVPIYETFVHGALDGIKTTIRLAPYILAIFVAVGIFRSSGALNILITLVNPLLNLLHFPVDLLTLAVLKPLSGSAALGLTAEILQKYGPDSKLGITASLIQGSCETTFYVLSLYLGSVNISNSRHLLAIGLFSELCAFAISVCLGSLIVKF